MIKYPNWQHMTGSVAFDRLNDDSLADMVFYLWGDPSTPGNHGGNVQNGSATKRDTLRVFAVFSQLGLDSVRELNIGSIGRFQTEPFFAMELVFGNDLVEPASRDLSGFTSYELKRIKLDVRKKKDSSDQRHGMPPVEQSTASIDGPITVHVFPNPTGTSTNVEVETVAPGTYTVEVVAVNGMVSLRQEVTVESRQNLLRTFDVSRLASGYYVVRLYRSGGGQGARAIGTYPVVITR